MTRKQSLYAQIIDTRNEIDIINGIEPSLANNQGGAGERYIGSHTIAELECELNIAKSRLQSARRKKAIAEYYATESGMAYKTPRDNQIERLRTATLQLFEEAEDKIGRWLKANIGTNWTVGSIGNTSMRLELTDESGKHLTHHEVSIYFDGKHFEMNYGSFGSFDPTKSPYRSALLMGMAKLASPDLAESLKAILADFHRCVEMNGDEVYNLKQELDNPPIISDYE